MSHPDATDFPDIFRRGGHSPAPQPIGTSASLVAFIEDRIAEGALGDGDRLPSVRDAAGTLGLAPNTVAAAYRRLRERGLVIGRGRQGTQVSAPAARRAAVSAPLPLGIVDAMSGNPDPLLLPSLEDALGAAVRSTRADYGSAMILPAMADAARAWLAADAVPTDAITLASGAMDVIERVLVEYLRPGDRIGVEDPGHVPVFDVVAALGLVPVPIAVDAEGITSVSLRSALDAGVRAVIITPRAHNPTGAAITAQRAGALRRELDRHPGVLVIEDDHAGPVAGVALADLPRDRARWALVRSVAKSLGPDLRLAVLAGDHATVTAVETRLSAGPGWVSHLLQGAVAHLLGDPAVTSLVDEAASVYRARRRRLIEQLAIAGIEATGASGLQVWIPVPSEQPVADALRDAGFAIRVGSAYRHSSRPAVRVTVASIDNDQIDQVARELIAVLGQDRARRTPSV